MKSVSEAFSRYLAKGRAAFVQRETPGAREVFGTIAQAGGVPVLAHPGLLRWDNARLEKALKGWREIGLRGIEAHHTAHDSYQALQYDAIGRRLGLLVTGGSDFHGGGRPEEGLGSGMDAWHARQSDVQELFASGGLALPDIEI